MVSLWADYLDFFEKVIKEEGMQKSFEKYVFHPMMFTRLFAGAFHPIIHLGYALEFQIPLILAEGINIFTLLPILFSIGAN